MESMFDDHLEELKKDSSYGINTSTLPETFSGVFFVISIYLVSVLKLLPSYMKNRPALQLKGILLFYNAFQVVYSAILVYIYLKYIYNYGVITTRCAKGNDLKSIRLEMYPYFVAKHLDLLDTVFFVLRKKNNQVTFLHLFHHAVMVTWTWIHVLYHPTDHFVVVGMLNSFVHVLMYAYYGLSSLGPKYAKFVWWKKHLTKVQLIQFILVVTHLHYQQKLTTCPIPQFFHYFCLGSILSFFGLFINFYIKSYKKRLSEKKNFKAETVINIGCNSDAALKSE